MEATMKVPTHIFIFEKALSEDVFEITKRKTKKHDFEKITSEHYPTLFFILEIMCDQNWGGDLDNFYAVYSKEDFVTLKLSNLNPSHIFEYTEKFIAIIDEAHALYSFNDKLVERISLVLTVMNEYWDITVKNFEYKRQISGEYFSQIYEFIEEERSQILNALDEQLDDLNLA
jgi:hypothetical protein